MKLFWPCKNRKTKTPSKSARSFEHNCRGCYRGDKGAHGQGEANVKCQCTGALRFGGIAGVRIGARARDKPSLVHVGRGILDATVIELKGSVPPTFTVFVDNAALRRYFEREYLGDRGAGNR